MHQMKELITNIFRKNFEMFWTSCFGDPGLKLSWSAWNFRFQYSFNHPIYRPFLNILMHHCFNGVTSCSFKKHAFCHFETDKWNIILLFTQLRPDNFPYKYILQWRATHSEPNYVLFMWLTHKTCLQMSVEWEKIGSAKKTLS